MTKPIKVTFTHQILGAVSSRPPGMPVSDCDGPVRLVRKDAEIELFECSKCQRLIPTDLRTDDREHWNIRNEYPVSAPTPYKHPRGLIVPPEKLKPAAAIPPAGRPRKGGRGKPSRRRSA